MAFLSKFWYSLRNLRMVYVLNNLRHYRKLKSNKTLYKKYGVDKNVVSSISHKDIKKNSEEIPWLDKADALEKLKNNPGLTIFPVEWQQQLLQWPEKGIMILRNFAGEKTCNAINEETQQLFNLREIKLDHTESRVMNAWKNSPTIKKIIEDKQLLQFLGFTLGKEVSPFQTISFFTGSDQETHSDSIHMTTEPLGFLVATWLALEDISPDSGPLHYYPGSQKLPYVMGENFSHNSSSLALDEDLYLKYEKKIAEIIAEKKLEKEIFNAKKGDLLIWHANILHGGEKVTDKNVTRKSLVTHYFCKGDVLCYHEVTQRPAILP